MDEKEKNSRTDRPRKRSSAASGKDGIRQRSTAARRTQAGRDQKSKRPQKKGTRPVRPETREAEYRRTETRRPVRKAQSKRRRKRNLGIKIALLIILLIAAVIGAFLWKRYSPSKETYDRKCVFWDRTGRTACDHR